MGRNSLLPNPAPDLDLDQAVYLASRDYRGGQTALAYTVCIEPGTFQKKVSLSNATHRLTLPEFIAVADATDDPRIDEAYARHRGGLFYRPVPVPATQAALTALATMLAAEGQFMQSLADGSADCAWEAHEVAELELRGRQLIAQVLGIMAGARAEMEGSSHG